jgi:hypothetical protein
VWSVKFSLLLFFWRLFDSLRTRMRIFWYVMCFVTASTYLITIFLQLFACGSPGTFFKFGEQGCHTPRDIYLSNLVFLFSAGTDIACDVFLIFIPIPLLWKLQISQRQRIILAVIFLLPFIPITFGILRLVFCNPTTGTVNVIKFTFYSMLENTAGAFPLPSRRTSTLTQPSNHNSLPTLHAPLLPAENRQHDAARAALWRCQRIRRRQHLWQTTIALQQQVPQERAQRCYTTWGRVRSSKKRS